MKKKISAMLLAILLLMTQALAIAEEVIPTPVYDHLVVGNPTHMKGDFFTELWGNATSDIDVRDLLHGYNLVRWDGENGMFAVDPSVVSGVAVVENEDGDRSYILVLYDDLYYSDGSAITAWDYAFSFLFQIAPEIYGAGGKPIRKEHLLGFEEYLNGEAKALAGVHVVDDSTLVITLRHEFLPFFYELGLLYCNPYPISEIAPGVVVKDDGEGVYLANEDESIEEPIFTAELILETVCDPERGYASHPEVVSGPYCLTSWDGTSAEFEINPYFKGDANGDVPTIQHLTYTLAENETMMDQLAFGMIDLLNKVTRVDAIMDGMTLMGTGEYNMGNYPRVGLSYLSFACERDTVKEQAVRQAIAWCMDRDEITMDYVSSFGLRVDGYYGVGQWMYSVISGGTSAPVDPPEDENDTEAMAAYEAELAAWEALSLDGLTAYTVDTDKASALLDAAGWKRNADGLREKDGTVLDLKLCYPEGNTIVRSFEQYLVPNLEQVGIRLTMDAMPMSELLQAYYKNADREADMYYLASNFDIVFDPSVNFIVDENGEPNWSYTNHADQELYDLAIAMRQTEPGAVLEYIQKWIAFEERFNDQLPMLPIYSNVYFDFYTNYLHNYMIAENVTWSQAILAAYLAEPTEADEAEDAEAYEDFDLEDDELVSFDD